MWASQKRGNLLNEYEILLFNFTQQSTNNTQNEYKYLTIFVLQKTGLTRFYKRLRYTWQKMHCLLNKTVFLE